MSSPSRAMRHRMRAERRWWRLHRRVPPLFKGSGEVRLGSDVVFSPGPVRSHITVRRSARLTIGDDVRIGSGAAISCSEHISIGAGSRIGPLVMIMDSDFHVAGDPSADAGTAAITIGERVRVGEYSMILPRTVIGDDVEIAPGSIVSGLVPNGARIAGNPAMEVVDHRRSATGDAPSRSVVEIAAVVFELEAIPPPDATPADIPAWNSLGALRLMIEIERRLTVQFDEQEFVLTKCLGEIQELVDQSTGAERV